MKPIRALIVDDEVSARSRLARLLKSCPQIQVEGTAENGLIALNQIATLKPDVVFLDVQMPGMTGFEMLRALPGDIAQPHIVFITAYEQHALAAFEADAIAYLLKPVQREKLVHIVERLERLCGDGEKEDRQPLQTLVAEFSPPLRQVVVREGNRFLLLRPAEIVFFQIEEGIARAFTPTDSFSVNFQIAELEASLPVDKFFRASRSTLINLDRIREVRPFFKSTFIVVMNDAAHTEIQVGERRAKALRHRIPGL